MEETGPTQLTLAGLPRPRARRVTGPRALATELPVARVVVDRAVPHLDRVFEYGVPAALDGAVRPGVRVRVRFGGQDVDGFVVGRAPTAEHDGDLAPLRRVVSEEVVLTEPVRRLTAAVAERYAGTVSDVLRLAVPPRHARTEAEQWPPDTPDGGGAADPRPPEGPGRAAGPWEAYRGGPAFLRHLSSGGAPRAVWSALPGTGGQDWTGAIASAVVAARGSGRGALVVVPSAADVVPLLAALEGWGVPPWSPGRHGGVVRLVADDGPAARYRAFLALSRGHADVAVGTRAAAFAPVRDLGLAVCWDDGDALHAEPRAPYPHTREVLALRTGIEDCGLLVGGHARSTATQRWVADGFAHPLQAERATVRARAPRVRALTSVELAAEGPAAAARLPAPAWRAVRDGLTRGPVLVQVPRSGYVPSTACARCRSMARCPACHGPLGVPTAGSAPQCRWCGRLAGDWRCPECSGDRLRSVRVGSDRTAEELGRAFTGVPVRVSGASASGGVLDTVPATPALVVATPGAEPRTPSGYAAAVLLDAGVVTARDGLAVGEQALRTWMTAAALVRPAADGGEVLLVGDSAPAPAQALVRWDPAWFAGRELAERAELQLPPAVHLVAVEGPRHAVVATLDRAALPDEARVLGPLPLPLPHAGSRPTAGPDTLLDLDQDAPVRVLVRSPWGLAGRVTGALAGAQAVRSARREVPVRLQVEPPDIG